MTPPHGWDVLSRRARWRLEHSEEIMSRGSVAGLTPCLRLWQYRARGAHLSWTVFMETARSEGNRRPVVREIRWERRGDEARLRKCTPGLRRGIRLDPTCRIRDADVAESKVREHLNTAATLMDRHPPSHELLLEEEDRFGVEGFGRLAYLRHEWTKADDAGAFPVIPWVHRLRRMLLRCLSERERGS